MLDDQQNTRTLKQNLHLAHALVDQQDAATWHAQAPLCTNSCSAHLADTGLSDLAAAGRLSGQLLQRLQRAGLRLSSSTVQQRYQGGYDTRPGNLSAPNTTLACP